MCSRSQTETMPSSVPITRLGKDEPSLVFSLDTSPDLFRGKAGVESNGPGTVSSSSFAGAIIAMAVIGVCVDVWESFSPHARRFMFLTPSTPEAA